MEAPPLAQAPARPEAPAPSAPAAREIATAWLDAFRRRDAAALSAVTGYPFELRDTGTAGRQDTREVRRTAAASEQMPEVLASWLSDDVLDRTMKGSQTGQMQELAQISYWAKRWRSEAPPDTRPSEAYFSTNGAAFTFLFLVEGARVRAVWKTGFDASVEVELATQWLDALRRKDIDSLEHLTSYPFELRDAEVEAHCGDRRATAPKQMPKAVDCLLDDPIFNKALDRIRSKLEAASSSALPVASTRGARTNNQSSKRSRAAATAVRRTYNRAARPHHFGSAAERCAASVGGNESEQARLRGQLARRGVHRSQVALFETQSPSHSGLHNARARLSDTALHWIHGNTHPWSSK